MFKQSIDPKGAFPPKSSKKPVKKPKKAPIKRRKKTRDRFGAERQAEQVFKFGERRSGLSGRQIFRPPQQQQSNFSPGDFIRIHQQAIKNQIRDETEKKATGGTFTGTSIGEEKRVREQQQADREFRRQEADNRRRFVGAIERFVDKATTPKPEPKPDKEVLGALKDIKEEIKKAKIPVINLRDKPRERESVGIADIEEISSIGTPIPEHRQPEDDISFLSLDRSSRSHKTIPATPRPRPTPNNPSKSKAIPSQEKIDTSSFLADLERRSRQPEIELSQEEQEEIRHKIYDSLVGGLQRPAKQKELGYREPRPEPEPEFKLEEEEITPEARKRRSQFLEEGGDTTEFLTPTGDISPIKTPPELKKQLEEIKKATEEKRGDPIAEDPEVEFKIEAGFEKLTPDEEQVGSEAPQREPISDATRIQARLENYKALARFSESQKSIPKNFDNQKLHYRLQVLEDISAQELGRQKKVGGFSKGEQFRLQRTDYKGQKIANRGFYFYRDNKGKQQAPIQQNLFKINLANPKVDGLFQEAIKQGKIKIVYDEFDD
jgi:hypothetical protein